MEYHHWIGISTLLGVTFLTVLIGLEGVLKPFIMIFKYFYEFILYSTSTHCLSIQCTTWVTMAISAVHLIIIIIYHFWHYAFGRIKDNLTVSSILPVKRWLSNLFNRQKVQKKRNTRN